MATQTMLFETVTTDNGDGSFTVRPQAVRVERWIGTKRAMKILGYSKSPNDYESKQPKNRDS